MEPHSNSRNIGTHIAMCYNYVAYMPMWFNYLKKNHTLFLETLARRCLCLIFALQNFSDV